MVRTKEVGWVNNIGNACKSIVRLCSVRVRYPKLLHSSTNNNPQTPSARSHSFAAQCRRALIVTIIGQGRSYRGAGGAPNWLISCNLNEIMVEIQTLWIIKYSSDAEVVCYDITHIYGFHEVRSLRVRMTSYIVNFAIIVSNSEPSLFMHCIVSRCIMSANKTLTEVVLVSCCLLLHSI